MTVPAVDELLQHATALRRLARDLAGDAAADDVLQDAALQALAAPPRLPGPALGWLRTVVARLAGKHRRAARIRREHEAAVGREARAATPAADDAAAADTLRCLTDVVTTLPEPYRGTLFARYLREHTPAQIAADTGVPVRTVKTRLQRGLELLRERLDARRGDWRMAFAGAFGLRGPTVAGGGAGAGAAATSGILLMTTTTTKWLIGGLTVAAALALAWPWLGDAPPPEHRTEAANGPAAAAAPLAPIAAPAAPPAAPERVAAVPTPAPTPPAPTSPPAKPDEVVVLALDAATGRPIETFGLRATMAKRPLLPPGVPLQFGGEHPGGRLVVPQAEFAERRFLLEAAAPYLPSGWFGLAEAVRRNDEATIEVRLAAPRDLALRVVREPGGAPVAGTQVELLRPWPKTPEVTLRTNAVLATAMSVPPDEPEIAAKMFGGRAMKLGSAFTDVDGRAAIRVPPGEDFALRLLGPGHRPMVVQPWRVPADGPDEIVVAVSTGGSIRGRVGPPEVLAALRAAAPPAGPGLPAIPSLGDAGLQFRHVGTGEAIPVLDLTRRGVVPIAADGSYHVDGLAPGDWEMTFVATYLVQEGLASAPPRGLEPDRRGLAKFELPLVPGVGDLEPRLVDVDLTPFALGRLDASVVRDGAVLDAGFVSFAWVAPSGATKLPQGGQQSELELQPGHRLVANLPPARYVACLRIDRSKFSTLLLGEFEIQSGATTRIDFAVEVAALALRCVEADGSTPAAGRVQLQKDGQERGWFASQEVDGAGEVTFAELPRGVPLRAKFQRASPPLQPGQVPKPVVPIDLGLVQAGGQEVVVRTLPAK